MIELFMHASTQMFAFLVLSLLAELCRKPSVFLTQDDVYPKDFDIKPAVEEVRETRRRKGNSGQIQAVTPTTAAEGLLALASSGSAPSLVAAAMGVMGSPVAGGSDGGGGGGSRDLPYAAVSSTSVFIGSM